MANPGEKEKQEIMTTETPTPRTNEALVSEFEQGRAPGDFHHTDHVRVAFAYVSRFPFLEAVERFSAALKRFAVSKGKPNLYHETITWAYLFLIRERIARSGPTQSWEEFAERNPDLLIWKGGVLATLYRPDTLDSDLARHTFVLPDVGGRCAV
jgi:hypothetical protein